MERRLCNHLGMFRGNGHGVEYSRHGMAGATCVQVELLLLRCAREVPAFASLAFVIRTELDDRLRLHDKYTAEHMLGL